MKICPNCSKPFEEIAGRLFCQDHGWHALNPDGEIIPADAPTAEQVAAWEAAQKAAETQPAPAEDPEPEIVDPSPMSAAPTAPVLSEKAVYVAVIVAALVLAILAARRLYMQRKRRAVINGTV